MRRKPVNLKFIPRGMVATTGLAFLSEYSSMVALHLLLFVALFILIAFPEQTGIFYIINLFFVYLTILCRLRIL
jgi:hypothetical protein